MSTVILENLHGIKRMLKGQIEGWRSPCLAVFLGQERNFLVTMG